ncbi:hypothetical protein ACJRO7_028141 [Eucalyptus globulus]|uniref:Uncharacterized protein n=1 Tax=Eucalyptus globulus TaxID=34317 RepID=A0ABD3JYI4_EUCGL
MDGMTIATIGGSSVAASAAVLTLTDPKRRRQVQAGGGGRWGKEVVREYFNNSGFQRWKKIYGETDDVKHLILLENVCKKKPRKRNVVSDDSL